MTIAYPNKQKRINTITKFLVLGIILGGFVSVFLYNQTVSLRRVVNGQQERVDLLELDGAELKNNFYSTLDADALVLAAERIGLVKDNNPSYLTVNGTSEHQPTEAIQLSRQ